MPASVVVNDPGGAEDGTVDGAGADVGAAESVVREIVERGGEAVASIESVADWDGARRIVETALEAYGDLHVVVNNAGIQRNRALVELTEDDFRGVLDVHLGGTVAVTHWAARHWRDRHDSGDRVDRALVNTVSSSGLNTPLPLHTGYATAKAGVAAFTIVAALELQRYGVRVNAVAPSRARTRLTDPNLPPEPPSGFDPFHPRNISPLYAYLATADCPLTGQLFSAFGNTVTAYRRWRLAESIETDGTWRIDDLADRLPSLPVEDPRTLLAEALGVLGSDDLERMLDEVLSGAH